MTRWVMEAARMTGSKRPGSEEINIIVIVSSGGCRSGATTKGEAGAGFWELFHSCAKGLDVVVPEIEKVLICVTYQG